MNAFVLAGGRSTRMGRDKALLELAGRSLAELASGKLRALGLPVRICGAPPGVQSELARLADVVPDNLTGCGPLAGIEAGLGASSTEMNLFLAVDTPLIPTEFLRWMIERAERSGAVATIPIAGGMAQPLCAVYSRWLRDGLRGAMVAGHLKMMRAVQEAAHGLGERIDLFSVETVSSAISWTELSVVPVRDWFRNVNTPEEFAWLSAGTSCPPFA